MSADDLMRFLIQANEAEAGKRATPDERLFFGAMAQPIRTDIPRPADPLPWLDDEESEE